MHNWRRDGDKIGGGSDGGGSDGGRRSRDLCRWRRWSRLGAFAYILLDDCRGKGSSAWRVVPKRILSLG